MPTPSTSFGATANPRRSQLGGYLFGASANPGTPTPPPMNFGTTESSSEAQTGTPAGQSNILQQIMSMLGNQQANQGNNMNISDLAGLVNPRALDPVATSNAGTRNMYGFGDAAAWNSFTPDQYKKSAGTPPAAVAPVVPTGPTNAAAMGGLMGAPIPGLSMLGRYLGGMF